MVEQAYQYIGFYCGRNGHGLWGEPYNSLSNMAFVIGAFLVYLIWKKQPQRTLFQGYLILFCAMVGAGSFIFHSYPGRITIWIDLVPIQLFALTILGYILSQLLGFTIKQTLLILLAFFVFRQLWIVVFPRGLLGGGITHIPALLALMALILILKIKGHAVWKYLAASAACYIIALVFRSWDMPLCEQYPNGLHWIWHLLTASAATLIILGLTQSPLMRKSSSID